MRASTLLPALTAVGFVSAAPASSTAGMSKGFMNPKMVDSVGGKAVCVQGITPVTAKSTKNFDLKIRPIDNQTVVTEIFVEMAEIDSPLMTQAVGPMTTVSGTYNISSMLCYPKAGLNSSTVQLLTHGVGFDKSYWNFASEAYSYIDAAASAGYATFSYDRLGVGESAHPDALQVVQAPLEVVIADTLGQDLKNGKFGKAAFKDVVGVGHSFGSIVTQAVTATSPSTFSAVVLTGYSMSTTGQATFIVALDLTIAHRNNNTRFAGLSNGYLVTNNIVGNQFAFFRAQGFPYSNLLLAEATKETVTFGELLTLNSVAEPAKKYTGAVDVVNGINDFPFCQGNCTVPHNQAAAVIPVMFPAVPAAKTAHYLAPDAGHGLNAHYSAGLAYKQIMAFVKKNVA